ncbi:hypothetical protein ABBQ32_002981 [Trebouxia sp. C0010 RCD-2024]
MQNNLIMSLEDLAAFKSFTSLRHLKVGGGHPGNPVCNVTEFQQIVVQLLPQLETLDGQTCATVGTQHLIAVKEQQKQQQPLPLVHHQQPLQQQPQCLAYGPVVTCADTGMYNYQPLALPLPAPAQQPRHSLPAAAATALMQAKAVQRPLLDTDSSQGQGNRIAALESRLRDVVNMRSRPPLAPTENLLHQPVAARKARPKTVVHEVACQTATSMAQVDRLHQDAAHLKQELQHLASELDNRTSHAVRVEEQAEALVQQAQQDAEHQVVEVRRQANEALHQAQAEITEAEQAAATAHQKAQDAQALQQSSAKQLAELQWELQHAWQQSDRADKAQQAALQAAQDRLAMLEADCRRSSDHAARVEEKAARAEAEGMRLSQELTDAKAALQASHQAETRLDSELQKCRDAISSHDAAAAAAAASLRAELEALQQQLSDSQRHAEGLQVREEEARSQAKQLATALTAAQVDYQRSLECKVKWYEDQVRREVEGKQAEAAKHAQQQEQLQASRDALQKHLAVTEAEFRLALQEHERVAHNHQQQLQQQSTAMGDLRRALQTAHQQHQEQESLVKELTEVLQRQKTRVAALQKDRAGMSAQLAAYQPAEQDKLRAEMNTLRERVGELAGIKEHLTQEQQHSKQLQAQLHAAQASHDQAAAAAASQLAAAQQALSQLEQEATEKLSQADAAAAEAEGQLDDLMHELEESRDAVKVKEAMVDDAQASIAALKTQLSAAQAEAAESAQALRHAEEDLSEHEAEEQRQHQSLRLEIEAQERALEQLEKSAQEATRRAHDAEQKARSAQETLKEKDQMLKYVEEEVDRVKGLFEQKEARLTSERDSAKAAAQQLAREQEGLIQKLHKLEHELQHLPGALEAEKAKSQAVEQACHQAQEDAKRCVKRLNQVEDEMRELLSVMEQQKASSAAKVKQLATILQDMQAPSLH